MVVHAARVLRGIRWTRSDVGNFLGRFLSEPKAHVVFRPPRRALARGAFARALRRAAVVLDARTQMLTLGARCFVNGETLPATRALRALANRRRARLPAALAETAYRWYLSGYLHLERVR